MHRSSEVESSLSSPHKNKHTASLGDEPISMTTATKETSNVYEPVSFNTDHGTSNGMAIEMPETSNAAVTANDKVLRLPYHYL